MQINPNDTVRLFGLRGEYRVRPYEGRYDFMAVPTDAPHDGYGFGALWSSVVAINGEPLAKLAVDPLPGVRDSWLDARGIAYGVAA